MTTSTFAVHGVWRSASSAENINVEAQTMTIAGPFTLPIVPEPVRAAVAPTRMPHGTTTSDSIDAFFCGDACDAREPTRYHPSLGGAGDVPLPPYADTEPPVYSEDPNMEPITLAMYLFKFGFLFPPLWVLGTVILVSPLIAPADFESSKSGRERRRLVQIIRDAELKWAKRCAWALVTLFVLVGFAIAIALVVLRS